VFKYANGILFDKLLQSPSVDSASIELAKVLGYVMDMGAAYEVVRKREQELKTKLPSAKVQEDAVLPEDYILHFRELFS
jgi:hypothetical protein